jgi:hypothetical protein
MTSPRPQSLGPQNVAYLTRNWKFESIPLQRRVNCELDFGPDSALTDDDQRAGTELAIAGVERLPAVLRSLVEGRDTGDAALTWLGGCAYR